MQGRAMTEGTPWKHTVRFALPVLAGSFLQQLYNTADTIIIGRFAGEASMSAVGTTVSLIFMFTAIALGISTGNGVVVAQYFGAKKEGQMREAASTGILLLLALGAAAAVVGILISRPVFTVVLDVPKGILETTIVYFRIYSIGLVFQFGYNIFSSILRGVGDSAATLYFLLISSVANIILDLLFVGGFGWGAAGAAAATDISQAISFVAAYFYMIRKYPVFRFRPKELVWRPEQAKQTVRIGSPIAIQLVIVSMGLTLIIRAANGFGQTMTASYTVGQRIEMYINLPCHAFQSTLATYTGQNIGAGRMDRVKTGFRQTYFISLGMTVIISACVWIFAANICNAFDLSPEAAAYCVSHLRGIAVCNLILSAYIPFFGLFQGANHPGFPAVTACTALSIRVIVTYLFRYSDYFGYTIIWWNGLFGFSVALVITWIYYLSGRWMRNSVISVIDN